MATGSEIDEAFISMRHRIVTKIKNYACEDWIVLDVIMKYSIKTFLHQYMENRQLKNEDKN